MRYTIMYIDNAGNWKTLTCISSHDRREAWDDVQQYLPAGAKIQFFSPGDQIIYTCQEDKVVIV
jgi:hypothetical protein